MNGTCDQCSTAKAHVSVTNPESGGTLDFCTHHFNSSADRLLEAGFTLLVTDTRNELATVGAPASVTEDEGFYTKDHPYTDGNDGAVPA